MSVLEKGVFVRRTPLLEIPRYQKDGGIREVSVLETGVCIFEREVCI